MKCSKTVESMTMTMVLLLTIRVPEHDAGEFAGDGEMRLICLVSCRA